MGKFITGLIIGAFISGFIFVVIESTKPTTVRWTLHEPGILIGERTWKTEERMQLGLRSDGIVVWRKGYQQ